MRRKTIYSFLATGVIAALAIAGLFTYQTASAQTDETPSTTSLPARHEKVQPDGRSNHYTDDDLAAALGVELSELQTARVTAWQEALKQAVNLGLITQEQADEFADNDYSGQFPVRKTDLSDNGIDYNALLADALGLTIEDLQSAKQEARNISIDRSVEEGTLTQAQAELMKGRNTLEADDTFLSSMQSAYETAIQQAVESGVITQEQADLVLENSSVQNFFGRQHLIQPGGGKHNMENNLEDTELPTDSQ